MYFWILPITFLFNIRIYEYINNKIYILIFELFEYLNSEIFFQ